MELKLSNDKIFAKLRLLPKEKQDAIKSCCKTYQELPALASIIRNKLPKISLQDQENSAIALRNWLDNSDNFLFLPFVWDLFSVAEEQGLDSKVRINFAQSIANLLKPKSVGEYDHRKDDVIQNLYYANFNKVDLSRAYLFHAQLVGAIFVDAILDRSDLTQANAEGADFSEARGLTDNNIYQLSLRSLYRVKFKLQDLKDPCELCSRIMITYVKKLAALHNLDQNTVQNLLAQIELSGFSPFQWAFEEEKFNQQFDLLKNAPLINHAALLQTIKDRIAVMIPKDNLLSGSYYKNRLNTEGPDSWKPIFAENPRKSRTTQIAELQKIAECAEFSSAVGKLIEVKTQIEQEWKIWNSELLKQINALVQEINPQTTASTSSTSVQLTQSN